MNGTALGGTIVVELGERIGVGVCGSILAQLGATVVLVESPASTAFSDTKWQNRNQIAAGKLSFCPESMNGSDFVLLNQIVQCSDAVLISSDIDSEIEKRLEAGWKDERVICDLTAYGRSAQSEKCADTEVQVQATSGIIDTTGLPDRPPVPIMIPIIEFMTGTYAAAATISALRIKRQTGRGQVIDMALYDCAFATQTTLFAKILIDKSTSVNRLGNQHPLVSPSNVFRAKDGWVLIFVGSDVQWQRLCGLMDCPELGQDARYLKSADRVAKASEVCGLVQSWVGGLTVVDCIMMLSSETIPCGPILEIRDYPSEPNLEYRGMINQVFDPLKGGNIFIPGSPLRMSVSPGRTPDRLPEPGTDRNEIINIVKRSIDVSSHNKDKPASPIPAKPTRARLPLTGVRVLEIGHYTTVPLCTKYLASIGAEVIKIEPPEGETTRPWPPTLRGQGYYFTYMNSDKRSMTLDLGTDNGVSVLSRLIKDSDVLMENLKPGALAKRGFSPTDISRLNPRIIYCAVSGFGVDSVYPGRAAFDTVIQAMSGMMDIIRCDGVPMKSGISSADQMGSAMAVVAVLAALEYRDSMGIGQFIDLSMQDIGAWMTQFFWNGKKENRRPISVIRCSDGYVVAEVTNLALNSELRDKVSTGPPEIMTALSRSELVTEFARNGIGTSPVLTVPEMLFHPRTESRRLWFTVNVNGEKWPLLASPLRLLGTPPLVRHPMPSLGRDNSAILNDLFGRKSRDSNE